jgi:protein-disulfide isomerase
MNVNDSWSSRKWNGIMAVVVVGIVAAMIGIAWQYHTNQSDTSVQTDPFPYQSLPMLGSPSAPVKIVEFGDFKCPDCKQWEETIFPQLKREYLDTGKAQLYFMNFPVVSGSETAELVGRSIYHQNNQAFWDFYTAIYQNQQNAKINWATESFLLKFVAEHVKSVDLTRLQNDVEQKVYQAEIEQEKRIGKEAGVTATPTFFINGKKVQFPYSYEHIQSMIEQQLKEKVSSNR